MAASRKLYVAVATELNHEFKKATDPRVVEGLTKAAEAIATAFKRDNMNFQWDRFMEACRK